ncbi:hypothetical protein Taro_035956 [Colocasia esculenta]|uniref:Uncharacterized protein n=1 Tax=Colocasia esculenta TaxID=4460 RepID=A0A843W1S7_COLES|nr:hypothetical protein [Colocasia esculenta]
MASSTTPTVVTSPVGCPRFFVSQAVSLGLCPGTCVVPSRSVSSDLDTLTLVFELHVRLRERRQWDSDTCVFCSVLGEFPTELVTSEAHPYPHKAASARSREADSDQVRYQFNGLGRGVPPQLVSEQEISGMADRRDWGGGGDDPEESTQRMIERIWESLTDIRTRMDQQAPVPPVAVPPGDGEAVPVAPVPPRVERPGVAVDWLASRLVDVDFLNLAAVGSEEWLDERRMRGIAELREETSRRGAIPVGARGGLGVNREITGDSNAF